jgi:hypothetical protein
LPRINPDLIDRIPRKLGVEVNRHLLQRERAEPARGWQFDE